MESLLAKNLMFSINKFDDWKIQMQAHLAAMHDEKLNVILEGSLAIMKFNPTTREVGSPTHISTPKKEWITGDGKRNNLDNVAKDILFNAVDDTIFSRIRNGKIAKEVRDDQRKVNKLM